MIKSDNRPLYLKVIDKIKEDIDNEKYKPRERLPSEFDLSKQLGVSRATLREALRMLEDEGVIYRRHGVGTFVNPKPLFSSGIEELFSITEMIARGGKEPGTNFLSSYIRKATNEDMSRFRDENLTDLLVFERVRTADGEPVVYCLDTIPTCFLTTKDFSNEFQSLFEQLEKANIHITYALTNIEPLGFHEKISQTLQCEPETALLVLKQMHFDDHDRPVLYSLNYFRADKFKFKVLRKRVSSSY